jgi:hypothetical protein
VAEVVINYQRRNKTSSPRRDGRSRITITCGARGVPSIAVLDRLGSHSEALEL